MTKAEELAADYWIENTDVIYKLDLHISSPIMDAFKAGYEAGSQSAAQAAMDLVVALRAIKGRPTLKDLVKLAKRIRQTAAGVER